MEPIWTRSLGLPCAGWADDCGERCTVRGSWKAFEDALPPPASLEALVGPQRAKILQRLDNPATAGALAELLHGAPSMVTHHLRALERAGPISRDREGRNVWVRRTAGGSAVTAMYAPA